MVTNLGWSSASQPLYLKESVLKRDFLFFLFLFCFFLYLRKSTHISLKNIAENLLITRSEYQC